MLQGFRFPILVIQTADETEASTSVTRHSACLGPKTHVSDSRPYLFLYHNVLTPLSFSPYHYRSRFTCYEYPFRRFKHVYHVRTKL